MGSAPCSQATWHVALVEAPASTTGSLALLCKCTLAVGWWEQYIYINRESAGEPDKDCERGEQGGYGT
jgi:hypothetical protein